ncbi:MAG: ribonucleotide-diphosphate reductase subunit beta [Solirubrobacteraceae bacterium]|nr:ribonucleotide-diphosphate reductase subunit beta [Solirubrobacteraceae bacterium]
MSTTAHRAVTAGIDYADLYARWERGNWSATAIDFAQDRVDWHERMTDEQRRSAVWFYTLFFHGEDAVTDGLSPYIDAAPLEEQKYFLATQQVDEARHSVFFKRFMAEVAGLGDGTMAGGMLATESLLTWGHRKIFGKLDEMADRLRADRSLPQLCRAIALYHLIIEGALAQPGQHFMETYLERMDMLPGFREGIRHVSLDEQRHIAFGVKLLADAYATDPAMTTEAIRETLQDVGAHMAAIAMPPGWDETYYTTFGFTYDELAREGMRLLEMRLKAIGLDLERLDRFPIPFDVPFDERARRGRVLLEANLTGPDRPASRDRYATGVMFDALRRQADPRMVKPGTTIAWDFTDAEPWHISFDAGRATSGAGMTEHPDLRLRIGFDDWADMFAGRESPRRQLLTRRLRPRGDLRLFLRMRRIFA